MIFFLHIHTDRATEIEKNNLNLFNKMRAIIHTKHSTWRKKMANPTTAVFAPRINSALSNGSMQRLSRSRGRQGSARSERSVTLSAGGEEFRKNRPRSRSISSVKSERKRIKDRELMVKNVKQLKRL